MSTQEKPAKSGYPEVLLSQLPEAKVAFEGARAWIMQSESNQLVFFEFEAGMNLPDHNHTYPQWGMVMEGEMELRLDGKPISAREATNTSLQPALCMEPNSLSAQG